METNKSHKINKYIFLSVILIMAFFLLYAMSEFFTAFLGSIMFYVLFKSWMAYLVGKKKWKKGRAALLIMLVTFVIILIPITIFLSLLYSKANDFIGHPELLLNYLNSLDAKIQNSFNIKLLSEKNIEEIQGYATSAISGMLNVGLAMFASIGMMYFLLYFMLISFNRLEAAIVFYLPFSKTKILMFGDELKSETFSNAIGVPLIAVVQGFVSFFIYYLCGVPEAAFWGILTGFASIIPIVGTGIIWVPICIFLFANGQIIEGIGAIVACGFVMGSLDNVIRFMLAKKMADVHPVVTVLGVIIGLNYLGITGLIFGPLLISYFIILLKIYYAEYQNVIPPKKKKPHEFEINVPFIFNRKFKNED